MTIARDAHRTGSLVWVAVGLCLVAGALCAVIAGLVDGPSGAYGALVATVVVSAFFGLGHLVLSRLRDVDPLMYLLIALLTYVLQVVCLLAVFGVMAGRSDAVSTTALGVTIIACTVAWTTGLVVASRRQRIPLFDLRGEAR